MFKKNIGKLELFTVNITVTCNPTISFLAISVATLILSKFSYINTKHYGRTSPNSDPFEET